ncbi:MAG: LPP20 family lipoprotein [Spirochaetaceae bacterium]|nr:LPP20 family lipoprotein [Spirochaetaceae bacterium]
MKKIRFILIAPVIAALAVGCASSKGSADKTGSESSGRGGGSAKGGGGGGSSDIPEWFLNPPSAEDAIYGTGSAKMADLNMSIQMAESRARQSISFTLNANVQAMITDYSRSAGTAESQTSLVFAESVGRQVTQSRLTGAQVKNKAIGKDGTVYCLVEMKKADASKAAADIIAKESDQYAEFKAMQALDRMDYQLSKDEIKPVPVTQ